MNRTINRVVVALFLTHGLFVFPCLAGEAKPWLFSINLNQGSFSTSDLDSDGSQSVAYSQLAYDTDNWGVLLGTAYAATSYTTENREGRFDVYTLADTSLSTYYRKRRGPFLFRGGIDLILPTGKSDFASNDLKKIFSDDVGEDLIALHRYGAGLNIRPHAMATLEHGDTSFGAGINYEFTGAYDPTTDIDNDTYDPGDNMTLVASVIQKFNSESLLMLTGKYTTFGHDTLGGREIFKYGDIWRMEGRYLWRHSDHLRGTIGLIYETADKSDSVGTNDLLVAETGNRNNNIVELFADAAWRYTARLTLTAIAGYKQVMANGYNDGDDLYDAGRTATYIEPGLRWNMAEDYSVSAQIRYKRVSDRKDAFSPSDAEYTVINVDIGLIHTF